MLNYRVRTPALSALRSKGEVPELTARARMRLGCTELIQFEPLEQSNLEIHMRIVGNGLDYRARIRVDRKPRARTDFGTRSNRDHALTPLLDVERADRRPASVGGIHNPHLHSIVGSGLPLARRLRKRRCFACPAARTEMALSRVGSDRGLLAWPRSGSN
jgi:hypothetical protein